MPVNLTNCIAKRDSVQIFFSEPVDANTAKKPENYTIYAPPAFASSITLSSSQVSSVTYDDADPSVTIKFKTRTFRPGDTVSVAATNLMQKSAPTVPALLHNIASIACRVPDRSKIALNTKNVEDVAAYPILTEEIDYPSASASGRRQTITGLGAGSDLGQVTARAISDVLGWKANVTDAKGFVGALNQSFTLADMEGRVQATWHPRSYAVQSDLSGGISGAQASLYSRAKDALDQCIPLLDGLRSLDPEAESEFTKALQEMAKSQMKEIVNQLGMAGGPYVSRVDIYFRILLGVPTPLPDDFKPPTDADSLDAQSTLGSLRDAFGIGFRNNRFSNSIEDEQDITNFRIIVDYMLSLWQSWINNRDFFTLGQKGPAFFGTQLVLISRQFSVIIEAVDELRFALGSVFIGPSERQTMLLTFDDSTPSMFLEDILKEISYSAEEEWPRLIRDGGRLAVNNNLLPVADSLIALITKARTPTNLGDLPDGYRTARVRNALGNLQDQLKSLADLASKVGRDVPPTEGGLFVFPPALDFGKVEYGTQVTQTITIANMTPTRISNLLVKLEGPSDFTIGQCSSSSLEPNATTAVAVTWHATASSQQGNLKITADQKAAEVSLRGDLEPE